MSEAVLDEQRSSELIILDHSGDTKVMWNRGEPTEIAAARAMFSSLKAAGYMAYKTDRKGDKGDVVREFDADAERLIMSKPIVGG